MQTYALLCTYDNVAMDGSKALMIKANDKDVVAIAITVMKSLNNPGLEKMWMAFGQGNNYRLIPFILRN